MRRRGMTALGGATDGPAVVARLRVAGLLTLGALLALLLTELRYAAPAQDGSTLAMYGVYAAVAAVVLAATYTPLATRHAPLLAFAFSLGLVLAGLYTLYAERAHPMVAATGLFSTLMLTLVLFAWGWREMAVLAGAACLGFALIGLATPPVSTVTLPFAFAFSSLVVGSAVTIASARIGGRLRADLAARERDLVRLSQQLMSVQEEERRRLSRELHDGIGQSLTAILSYLWLIEQQLPPDATVLRSRTAEARRLASTTMAELRELSQLLPPSTPTGCRSGSPRRSRRPSTASRRRRSPMSRATRAPPACAWTSRWLTGRCASTSRTTAWGCDRRRPPAPTAAACSASASASAPSAGGCGSAPSAARGSRSSCRSRPPCLPGPSPPSLRGHDGRPCRHSRDRGRGVGLRSLRRHRARRLGRGGDQGRAPPHRRSDPRAHHRGHRPRCRRAELLRRAPFAQQAQRGHRPRHARRSGAPRQAGRARRRVLDELSRRRARAPAHHLGGSARGEPAARLRAGLRAGAARPRCAQGRLRRRVVLGPRRHRRSPLDPGRAADPAAPRLRRLHRWHGDRGRHRGRPLPSR